MLHLYSNILIIYVHTCEYTSVLYNCIISYNWLNQTLHNVNSISSFTELSSDYVTDSLLGICLDTGWQVQQWGFD